MPLRKFDWRMMKDLVGRSEGGKNMHDVNAQLKFDLDMVSNIRQ